MEDLVEAIRKHIGRPPLAAPPPLSELAAQFSGRHILIVGNGPSGAKDFSKLGLPTWTVSSGWINHPEAALAFMMDDFKGPAWDNVAARGPQGEHEDLTRAQWEPIVRLCHIPIMTSVAYTDFPQTVAYPVEAILNRFGRPYFGDSVCYTIAWAIHIGVSRITFAGCDYVRVRPAERASVEYWIGRAEQAGIKIDIARGSSLLQPGPLDGRNRHVPAMYGYTQWKLPYQLSYQADDLPELLTQDAGAVLGDRAMEALLAETDIRTVLDVGCGDGEHARYLADAGKQVIGVDPACTPDYFEPMNGGRALLVQQDFLSDDSVFSEAFDAIWCCHVLEHVDDPQAFLRKIRANLRQGGLLALTVPPAQHAVVGGHFTLWNAGLLLYHLLRAGFNCKGARIRQYGYNLSVLVRNEPLPASVVPQAPNFEIEALRPYLPDGLEWRSGIFNGDIRELNWSRTNG